MNYRDKIRKAIECPQFDSARYGEWGMLNLEQRKSIKRLLDELDSADNYIAKIYKENQQLKEQLQQKEDIINKANTYVIENANIYLNIMGNKVGFFKENDGKTPIELLEILDNKGE